MEHEAELFVRGYPTTSKATRREKRRHLRGFLRFVNASGRPIESIRQADLEAFVRSLTCDQAHKQQTLCTVRQFYDHAYPKLPNPAAKIVMRVNHHRKPVIVPSQAAVESVIDAKLGREDEFTLRNRVMVELAYGSALRRGEIARLNVEDVDLAENTVRVIGKGGYHRITPLTHACAALLRAYLRTRESARGPLLLSYRRTRIYIGDVWRLVKKTTGYNTHLFRHACATHLLQNGCDLRLIQELLGHRKLDTTRYYTSVDKTDLAAVVERTHPRKSSMPFLDATQSQELTQPQFLSVS